MHWKLIKQLTQKSWIYHDNRRLISTKSCDHLIEDIDGVFTLLSSDWHAELRKTNEHKVYRFMSYDSKTH